MQAVCTTFEAIGTRWEIQIDEPLAEKAWAGLQARIHRRIEQFDKNYSRFRADSFVTRLSKRAGTYDVPDDGYKLLQCYEQLYAATDGKITPLIGQTMTDAGYDASYSFEPKALVPPPRWEDVLSYSKHKITLKQPALLDFGAAGKGYLVDILSELIWVAGVRSYVINAGGDILQRSATAHALQVGLENPLDTSEAIGIVRLTNASLCASAGSKRKWQQYHHIIDPTTLVATDRVLATWVLADDTMMADGLATALFFVPAQRLAQQFAFAYAVLMPDMSLQHSPDFPVAFFEADEGAGVA